MFALLDGDETGTTLGRLLVCNCQIELSNSLLCHYSPEVSLKPDHWFCFFFFDTITDFQDKIRDLPRRGRGPRGPDSGSGPTSRPNWDHTSSTNFQNYDITNEMKAVLDCRWSVLPGQNLPKPPKNSPK